MAEIDLSGIDPLRLAEVRRRIDILNRFGALKRPTGAQSDAFAAEMGTSKPQFYRLAKLWRLHKNPLLLCGGTRKPHRAQRTDGVTPAVKKIVSDVIEAMGSDARISKICREVAIRCERVGEAVPSRSGIWPYVMDARARGGQQTEGPRRIVLGRVWAKVPTLHEGTTFFPEILLACELPSRRIVGFDISVDPARIADPALALAMAFTAHQDLREGVEIVMDAGDAIAVRDVYMHWVGSEPQPMSHFTTGILSRSLGRRLAEMPILYRPTIASTERLLKSKINSPVSGADAIEHIKLSIGRHNDPLPSHPSDYGV